MVGRKVIIEGKLKSRGLNGKDRGENRSVEGETKHRGFFLECLHSWNHFFRDCSDMLSVLFTMAKLRI